MDKKLDLITIGDSTLRQAQAFGSEAQARRGKLLSGYD